MHIPTELIKWIEDRTDIVTLMRSHGVVVKSCSATQALALCPWHDDSTPSLSINRKKNLYYCFGCGAKGNLFTYIIKVEGISYFPDAVRRLAEIAGINLEKELNKIQYTKKRRIK